MVSEALIGAVSGVGVGVLFGIICLIVFFCFKRRTNARKPTPSIKRIRKSSFPPTGPIFISTNIEPFQIPPIETFEVQTKSVIEHEQQTDALSPPVEVNKERRCSLNLSDILTGISVPESCPRKKSSPASINTSNEKAIATLYAQQKKALAKKTKYGRRNTSAALGKLEFSLYYNSDMQELQIDIVRGTQLYVPSDETTTSFAIKAVILFDGEEVWQDKTKPAEASCETYFGEQLIVHGVPVKRMRKGTLKLMVMDNDTRQYGGEVVYQLCNLPFNMSMDESLKVSEIESGSLRYDKQDGDGSKYGELFISMCHNRNEKKLTVGVEAAKGLPPDYKGSIDSFVKVDIMYLGKRLDTRSTKVVPRNRNPAYENAVFHFEIPDDKLPQVTVVFKVKHHGKFSKMQNKKVGMVKLGYDADQELEYKHLEQVLDKPHLSIGNWHVIRKYR